MICLRDTLNLSYVPEAPPGIQRGSRASRFNPPMQIRLHSWKPLYRVRGQAPFSLLVTGAAGIARARTIAFLTLRIATHFLQCVLDSRVLDVDAWKGTEQLIHEVRILEPISVNLGIFLSAFRCFCCGCCIGHLCILLLHWRSNFCSGRGWRRCCWRGGRFCRCRCCCWCRLSSSGRCSVCGCCRGFSSSGVHWLRLLQGEQQGRAQLFIHVVHVHCAEHVGIVRHRQRCGSGRRRCCCGCRRSSTISRRGFWSGSTCCTLCSRSSCSATLRRGTTICSLLSCSLFLHRNAERKCELRIIGRIDAKLKACISSSSSSHTCLPLACKDRR
mmetsp:Transcript_47071/g.81940  ORF Transcript_47071/g.81940 Transcript_47071/m.81940 type:complete len:329 (+) Transcript_47071:3-989(+)